MPKSSAVRLCNCAVRRNKRLKNETDPIRPQDKGKKPPDEEKKKKETKEVEKKKKPAAPPAQVQKRNQAYGDRNIRITQIRRFSSSASSISAPKATSALKQTPNAKNRPFSAYETSNVTLRRNQHPTTVAPPTPQNEDTPPSRAPSITNLATVPHPAQPSKLRNAPAPPPPTTSAGTKPKKPEGKERLAAPPAAVSAVRAVRPTEVDALQRQLGQMSAEKSALALKVGEQSDHLGRLYNEVGMLKGFHEEAVQQLRQLLEENDSLRNRLRDVSHSPLSDNEKQQLLFETAAHRQHNSAPASMATNLVDGDGDVTTCTTPEWDKHSSGNVSEVSVACLQDKIHQMQETHYSTNEELQATLQELTDLQRQLTDLQQENLRINDEKTLMFESLCRQTERLNESRNEVDTLKQQLYKDVETNEFDSSLAEREAKLVDHLKKLQDEKETISAKNVEFVRSLDEAHRLNQRTMDSVHLQAERINSLESKCDAKSAECKQTEAELTAIRDQCQKRQIEIDRLRDLLENARTKIVELETDRMVGDKSELDEMLDNARKEKDVLEAEVTHLREQLAISRNDVGKLKEQMSILVEECKVMRNNAKTIQSDLEYKLEMLNGEKVAIGEQVQQAQERINEMQVQAHCQNDERRQLSAVLSETQRNLNEAERRVEKLEEELGEVKRQQKEQEEEWEKFQNDLLTSVRVANDFKTEAQQDKTRLIMENKQGRERIKQLEQQIDKMKAINEPLPPAPIRPTSFQFDEFTHRRPKVTLSRQNSRQSVKSLIECIENAGKPLSNPTTPTSPNPKLHSCSSSSNSSLNSIDSNCYSLHNNPKTQSPSDGDCWMENLVKTPLKEQQPNKIVNNNCWSGKGESNGGKGELGGKRDENYTILSKGLDFSRRNSYSDLSERKDPLNGLVKNGGSKRNALLKWCQNKTVGYRNIDITNFSSSWNDGLALCALMHTYQPELIPYDNLNAIEKRRNFSLAFNAAESFGIPTTLNINDMIQLERPDWQQVMGYVTAIYKHFET